MKKLKFFWVILTVLLLTIPIAKPVKAQDHFGVGALINTASKKVLKTVTLKIQRLENKLH